MMSRRKVVGTMVLLFLVLCITVLPARLSASSVPQLLLPNSAPQAVKEGLISLFPDYSLATREQGLLTDFLRGEEIAFVYDYVALPILESGAPFHFYPLYTDVAVIALDRAQTADAISSWDDVLLSSLAVSLPEDEASLRPLWNALSHAYSGDIAHEAPTMFLRQLQDAERLFWDAPEAPIQIDLLSTFSDTIDAGRELEIVVPEDGTLSFSAGLLSRQALPSDVVASLPFLWLPDSYLGGSSPDSLPSVVESVSYREKLAALGRIEAFLRRGVFNRRRLAPADNLEHHLASFLLIVMVLFFMAQADRWVIHRGVRRGLLLTGLLLVGWIALGVFKYLQYGYTAWAHASWYLYYFFSLSVPIISLYVAVNADRIEGDSLPRWLKVSAAVAAVFILLVLTNDYHEWIFAFTTDVFSEKGSEYTYGFGFTLLSLLYILSQFYSFFLMLKKSWDSPRRKFTVVPLLIVIAGISYSLLYNRHKGPIHEIPLVLGMSAIIVLFWTSAIYAGLIPTNRRYRLLFESSNLAMQIFDDRGRLRFASAAAETLPIAVVTDLVKVGQASLQYQVGQDLYWSSAITGGRAVMRESIKELHELRGALEAATETLEEENRLLAQKEQVESRLIVLNEQNRLAAEVNAAVQSKLQEMEWLVEQLGADKGEDEELFVRIHRIALYCKRECELLVKAKTETVFPAQELCRLVLETGAVMPPPYATFCTLEGFISFDTAGLVYECYHRLLSFAQDHGVAAFTVRLQKNNEGIVMRVLLEGEGTDLSPMHEFCRMASVKMATKDLEDTLALILTFPSIAPEVAAYA